MAPSRKNNPMLKRVRNRNTVDPSPIKPVILGPEAVPLDLAGRDSRFPPLYTIPTHPLVPAKHGRLILAFCDYHERAVDELMKFACAQSTPESKEESAKRGFCVLAPSNNDYIIMRNKFGTGDPADDYVVSWALARGDLDDVQISNLVAARDGVLGPPELMSDGEVVTGPDGIKRGGTLFQRGARAIPLASGPGCYPLGVSHQLQKSLGAPNRTNKVFSLVKDQEEQARFDLLKYGAISAMQGLENKGPVGLFDKVTRQAELANIPRVGIDTNVAHPSYQLNIASAQKPREPKNGRDVEVKGKFKGGIVELGKFGGAHIDAGDGSGAPTAMHVLSEPHPDVEEDYFYLLELGVSWLLEEFSTIFFSGLHLHGGAQPKYRPVRTQPDKIFKRLTLIGYPQGDVLGGDDVVAFAALPNSVLLPIGKELRNIRTAHMLSERPVCTQATYTTDGPSFFEPISQVRHFSRGVVELVLSMLSQLDPALLPRLDVATLVSSISIVDRGRRVVAPAWDLAPGWRGEDVREGKDYTSILQELGVSSFAGLSPEQLARLWNSDNHTTQYPFDNEVRTRAILGWDEHTQQSEAGIPVCILAGDKAIGGRVGNKRGAFKSIIAKNRKKYANIKGKGKGKGKSKKAAATRGMGGASSKASASSSGKRKPRGESTIDQGSSNVLSKKRQRSDDDEFEDLPTEEQPVAKRTRNGKVEVQEYVTVMVSVEANDQILKVKKRVSANKYTDEYDEDLVTDSDSEEEPSPEPEESTVADGGDLLADSNSRFLPAGGADPGFLVKVTPENLQELKDLATRAFVNQPDSMRVSEGMGTAHVALTEILSTHPSKSSRNSALGFTGCLQTLEVGSWAQKADILLMNLVAWEWLEAHIRGSWKVDAGSSQFATFYLPGLAALLLDVERAITSGARSVKFDAANYLEGFDVGEEVYTLTASRSGRSVAVIFEKTSRIVASWLFFPDIDKYLPQAWFTREVISRASIAFLSVKFVSKAANRVAVSVLGLGKNAKVTRERVILWSQNVLAHHPICDRSSKIADSVASIDRLVRMVSPLNPDLEKAVYASQTLLPPSSSSASSSCEPPPPSLPDPAMFDYFEHSLKVLYPLADTSIPIPLDVPLRGKKTDIEKRDVLTARFINEVRKGGDKKIPFRHLAPSLSRILQPGGPYSPENLRTPSGFFSALVFRGITHHTEFLLENQTFFPTLTAYTDLVANLKLSRPNLEEGYFCDPCAYGSAANSRGSANAVLYWKIANDASYNYFLTSSTRVNIYELFIKWRSRTKENPGIFAFGELTLLQLLADYAASGVVTTPTTEEMANMIWHVKKGALEGLRKLGWPCVLQEDVLPALSATHQELERRIPENIRELGKFDIFFVEHVLCKLGRFDHQDFKQLYPLLSL